MGYVYLIPHWFFGFDIAMEIIFAIIALAVSLLAYKMYKLSQERHIKLISASFGLIGLSYLIWAISNLSLLAEASEGILEADLSKMIIWGSVSLFAFMFLYTISLSTLAYATFKTKNGSIYYLLAGLPLIAIAASLNKFATFKIVSIFLLAFIVYHYASECTICKNRKANLMLGAFTFLLLSNITFLFVITSYKAYVLGHILELIAYILILFNIINITKLKK
jgi:hypothetical protein